MGFSSRRGGRGIAYDYNYACVQEDAGLCVDYADDGGYVDMRGNATKGFARPFALITEAGIQYSGSISSRPGYPRSDRPDKEIS